MTETNMVDNPQVIPDEIKPESAADYVQRGWLYYSQKKYDLAIQDYREALSREPDSLDTHYALAMAFKYSGNINEAAIEFSRVVDIAAGLEDHVRASMLSRLARGHIHEMKTGSWGEITEQW